MNLGLILFDFEATTWDWHEDGIVNLEASEDIVEHFVQNALEGGTHKDTTTILKLASCLGDREFNTLILSEIVGYPMEEVYSFWLLRPNFSSRNDCGLLSCPT